MNLNNKFNVIGKTISEFLIMPKYRRNHLGKEEAKQIKRGIEIYEVSNQSFIDGLKYLRENKFPLIILITSNDDKFLIIEGHSRVTIYGLKPALFNNSFGFIGYCNKEEMRKYDDRMI